MTLPIAPGPIAPGSIASGTLRPEARTLVRTSAALLLLAGLASAQEPSYTTFESFTTGASVDGQGGWKATNSNWDEEVVDDGTGNIAWRVSNSTTSGSFGDMPFSPGSDLYAGETGSMHVFDGASPVTNRFIASFDFWSVTGAPQPGLDVTISPDDGAGARQSFISIEDNGAGIDIDFFDTAFNHPVNNPNGGFFLTEIATGLSYGDKHNVVFDITFVDGNEMDGDGNFFGNDIVRMWVDGNLVHTGTTWESYWWTTTEGQTPPSARAIDTLLFRLSTPGGPVGTGFYFDNVFVSTKCPEDFQGFETDIDGWDVFSSPVFFANRVPSGTNGVTSATGNFHATASFANGEVPAGNWGGYGGNCGCPSTSCAVSPFPTHGYTTTVDIYLDVDAGWDNGTRFDYSSAINQPNGSHRRDFIFNAGFYNAGDASAPGSGSDRYIISASNNSSPGQNPANGVDPIAITSTGWYTFEHRFYRTPGDVLAVDLTIYDPSGASVGSWTRSNPTDIIGVTVGDNRYGWFPVNQFNDLAFDNATRFTGGAAELVLDAADCQDDADPAPGYQIAVELRMENLTSLVSGFQAFVEYPMGTLMYRGDLSSYTNSPFPNHILAINQADDGRLELDGTDTFGNTGTLDDSLLATLIFDVVPTCTPTVPATFELGGSFGSELSFLGTPLVTALNDAPAITLDDTAPMLVDVPANITQPSDAGACSGAIVSWIDPTATDDCDASPVIQCSPASGSFFAVGTTTVVCTATDACGNVSMSTFDVTVTDTVLVDVTVTIEGSAATTRCIRFVPDDCGSAASFELTFLADGLNATATDTIELPCGLWTQLCGKDEQHTFWDTVPLMLSGTNYATMTPLFLRSGDTDNDGDVDINDVTFFVAQFGGFAVDGGCPFDGTSRDSDFSNSGTVQIEDYAALVTNWLTTSDCACSALASGEADTRRTTESWIPVRDGHSARADLDQNGRVDWRDVALFEQRHGLSGELSRKMRD